MRNLKLSFAFVIAALAIGITFAANAKKIGSRAVTACFEVLQLRNAAGTLFTPTVDMTCDDVKALVTANQYFWLNTTPSAIKPDCGADEIYCCIQFEDVTSGVPAGVPTITPPGSPAGKYRIVGALAGDLEILCQP